MQTQVEELQAVQAEATKLKQQVKDFDDALEQSKSDQQLIVDLRSRITDLELKEKETERLKRRVAELEEASEQAEKLRQELARVNREVVESNNLRLKITELSQQLAQAPSIADMEQSRQQLAIERKSNLEKLQQAEAQCALARGEISQLQATASAAESKSRDAQVEKERLAAEMGSVKTRAEKAESEVAQSHQLLAKIQSELETFGAQANAQQNSLKSQIAELTQQASESASTIESLRGELLASESAIKAAKAKHDTAVQHAPIKPVTPHENQLGLFTNKTVAESEAENKKSTKKKKSKSSKNSDAAKRSSSAKKKVVKTKAKSKKADKGTSTKRKKDDLTRIEGIGPKTNDILLAKKITTFRKLAGTKVSRLRKILDEAGSRFKSMDPTTWAEQSQLAADGDWEKLKKLQDKLHGGRKK